MIGDDCSGGVCLCLVEGCRVLVKLSSEASGNVSCTVCVLNGGAGACVGAGSIECCIESQPVHLASRVRSNKVTHSRMIRPWHK